MNSQSIVPAPHAETPPCATLAPGADSLAQAIADAVAEGDLAPSGRALRSNSWTPGRIRIFLETLATSGVVTDAAKAAGMSARSAYILRNRAEGRAFHIAWDAAQRLARRPLAEAHMSRALHGFIEIVIRDGKVWGERHRHDNRFAMATLTRLDGQMLAREDEALAAHLAAQEFDEFLDLVCAEDGSAEDFIRSQRQAEAG